MKMYRIAQNTQNTQDNQETQETQETQEDFTESYEGDTMDIGSGAGYPAAALSNFSPHPFAIDGVQCASMEGFLQSLKYSNPDMQREVCTLVGKAAKFKGKRKKWWRDQKLYWLGKTLDRHGPEYQALLDRAF